MAVMVFPMRKAPQTPLPHPKSHCSRWWHGDPRDKEVWGQGRGIKGGTSAPCRVPPSPPCFLWGSRVINGVNN